jgi:hypothetical protein
MEHKVQHPNYNTSIELKYEYLNEKKSLYFNVYSSSSNCKLAIIENAVGLFYNTVSEENRIDAIKTIKSAFAGRNILITILNEQDLNWLAANFEHYYAVTVPCGYSGGNQYHILLKNRSDERKPIKYVQEKVNKTVANKDQVLEIINNAFKTTVNRDKRLKLIEEGLCSIE